MVLASCNWAFGASPASGGGEMLKLVFQRGSILHYRYHYTFSGTSSYAAADRPLEADSAGNLIWEVTSADASGVATIVSKETGSHNGSSGLASVTTSVGNTFQLAPDGRIVTPDPTSPFNQVVFVVLPEHPVRWGDTWRRTFSQADGAGGGSMVSEASGRLERYESLHGVRTAVITTGLESRYVGSKAQTDEAWATHSTTWLDSRLGRIEKVTMTSVLDLRVGGTANAPLGLVGKLTYELERVPV
jgi:hypothetical protein